MFEMGRVSKLWSLLPKRILDALTFGYELTFPTCICYPENWKKKSTPVWGLRLMKEVAEDSKIACLQGEGRSCNYQIRI